MRTMDRRDFMRIAVVGVLVVAATTLPSFAWPKKVTPNPSLVDKLQWLPESDARRIVSAYRDGRATPEEALPALFSLLDPNNTSFSDIAREVGRLRDFQTKEIQEIPKEKIEGLYNLVQLRDQYPDKFEETFEAMLKTGDSPEDIINYGLPVKTFNPYVEALYWLALDGKGSYAENILNNFDPKMLLIFAWPKPEDKGDTKEEKRIYKERWGEFGIVMDRLNTPLGLDCYIDHNIVYRRREGPQFPRSTFRTQTGHCMCLSFFGKYALDRAGFNRGEYKTFIRHVAWGPWGTHDHGGAGIKLKDNTYLLVINFGPSGRNKISGPYRTIDDLDNRLAEGKKIVDRMWGSYFAPR